MPDREKFGKFVLLEAVETSGLGTEYRAAKLTTAGLDKIVTVLRVRPDLSNNAETVKSLMDQVKFAAQLQNPNIVKLYGVGKVPGTDASFYISHEFIEGKSLQAVFARGRQEGFPFSVDHALLIASKVCSALEYAHGRKTEGGAKYFHGMVTPANVVVSYEGEVRTRGFGYWPARLRESGGLTPEEMLYLAPEQAGGGMGDTRSDVFAVGALVFQMLTGERFLPEGRDVDFAKRLADARLLNPTSEDDALPKPIREILRRSLTQDPAARFAEIVELRKAVDTLLFSGDFAPTTFNLAFFMHSLFREDIDRETRILKDEREANYAEYMTEEVRPPTNPPMVAPTAADLAAAGAAMAASSGRAPASEPADHATRGAGAAAASAAVPVAAAAAAPVARTATPTPTPGVAAMTPPPVSSGSPLPLIPPPPKNAPIGSGSHAAAAHPPSGSHTPAGAAHGAHAPATGHATPHPESSAREAAAGLTFHKEGAARSRTPLLAGVAALLVIGAGAAYFVRARAARVPATTLPAPTTLSADMVALQQKAKDLETKLQALEQEKAEAAAKAEEEAKKKVEAQAKARGQTADPDAVARAQDEARKKAQAEQERKAQAEKKRLEEEQRLAEEQLAEEQRRADEARAAAAATVPPAPTTVAAAPVAPSTPPPIRPGALVDVNDPGVIAPVAVNKPGLAYPPIALRQRIEGKVDLTVLVDEKGGVSEARVVNAAGGKSGLNEAASDYVKRWKFRPATKDGVAVKTWTPVSVVFMLPR